jgi:sodium/potassium-transporting ATPase subunit alpha
MTVVHAVYNSKDIRNLPAGRSHSHTDVMGGDASAPSRVVGDGEDPNFAAGVHPVSKYTGKTARSQGDFKTLDPDLQMLVKTAGLCNHANFKSNTDDEGKVIPGPDRRRILDRTTDGDASESALLKFAHSHINIDELRVQCPEVACVPFDSKWKWMATIHRETTESGAFSHYQLYVKGAPERLYSKCNMGAAMLSDIEDAQRSIAMNGERVLAFATKRLPQKDGFKFECDDINSLNFDVSTLTFCGLLSLEDPPRPEVPGAVEKCRAAGIRVIMVTGDHPLTARSIAGQVNIIPGDNVVQTAPIYDRAAPKDEDATGTVVEGSILSKFDDADWRYVLSPRTLFLPARCPSRSIKL